MNLKRIGLINIGLLILSVLAWVLFFYLPIDKEIDGLNNDIASLEQRIVQIGTIERNKGQIEKRIRDLENDLNRLFDTVEDESSFQNTLDYIEQLSILHSLEVEFLNPSPVDQFNVNPADTKKYFKKSLHSYPIDVFLKGKFIETGKFLEDLTAASEPVHIKTIHLLTDTQLPEKLHIEIKLLAYTAKD
jgi:Tfp pilus assembly protein PilO